MIKNANFDQILNCQHRLFVGSEVQSTSLHW